MTGKSSAGHDASDTIAPDTGSTRQPHPPPTLVLPPLSGVLEALVRVAVGVLRVVGVGVGVGLPPWSPTVGVGDTVAVAGDVCVKVGVGVSSGPPVKLGVGVSLGVSVGVSSGVSLGVGVGLLGTGFPLSGFSAAKMLMKSSLSSGVKCALDWKTTCVPSLLSCGLVLSPSD